MMSQRYHFFSGTAIRNNLLTLTPLFAFLVTWQLFGSSSDSRRFFFSTPVSVFQTFLDISLNGTLIKHTIITALEALIGFILGNLMGAFIGISLWYFEGVAKRAKLYLTALGAVPIFAIAPMTVLWFGIGIEAKIALALLATIFIAMGQAYKGVEQVDPLLLQRFKTFGAGRSTIYYHLLLPSAAVWIISSLRITIGASLLGAFVGEFIASEQGLGYLIIRASGLYDTAVVLVGVLTIVFLALILDWLVTLLERRILQWER